MLFRQLAYLEHLNYNYFLEIEDIKDSMETSWFYGQRWFCIGRLSVGRMLNCSRLDVQLSTFVCWMFNFFWTFLYKGGGGNPLLEKYQDKFV